MNGKESVWNCSQKSKGLKDYDRKFYIVVRDITKCGNMGWTNYIVIPKLKLVVETSRYVDEVDEYFVNAFKQLEVYVDAEDYIDISEIKVKDLNLKVLSELIKAYDIYIKLSGWEYPEKILLLFLELRNIDYEIIPEWDFKEKKYKGYTILRLDYD